MKLLKQGGGKPWLGRPFTGAWIETHFYGGHFFDCRSRPFTGAWIETLYLRAANCLGGSRPFTGAWIETDRQPSCSIPSMSPLHGGVD